MDWLLEWPGISYVLAAESSGISFREAFPILANGLLACVLVALLCSFLGVFVVVRRIVFVSAALAQVSSLGVATALFVGWWGAQDHGLAHDASPYGLAGAPGLTSLGFAAAAAILLSRQARERRVTRESILGIAYVLPAALVLIILDAISGETHIIENLLYGNAVFVPTALLWQLAAAAAVVFGLHALLYKGLVFAASDPESAQAMGVPVRLYDAVFYLVLALTVSIGINAIGALPVFGFMVMPAAAALWLADRFPWALAIAVALGVMSALAGFYLSFLYALPTGPALLLMAGLCLIPGTLRLAIARFSAP